MTSLGTDVGGTERVTVRDGVDDLGDGIAGIRAGTVLGPLPWGSEYAAGDDATYASETYGVVGVLLHDTQNGVASTLKVSGRTVARISSPVARGQLLALDPASPGLLHADTTGSATPVARALSMGVAGEPIPAVLINLPIILPDASGA